MHLDAFGLSIGGSIAQEAAAHPTFLMVAGAGDGILKKKILPLTFQLLEALPPHLDEASRHFE